MSNPSVEADVAGTTVADLETKLASVESELRHESAVAACAAAFLAADATEGLGDAIQALLHATDADRLFVAENIMDPVDGLCTRLVRVVNKGGRDLGAGRWQLVPWSRLPDAEPLLSRGEPFVFRVEDLGPTHQQAYAGTDVRSGAQYPIFVGERWLGVVGFADLHANRSEWSASELRLLAKAADLFARLWERQEQQQQLKASVADVRKRLEYERALAECSRALLAGTGEKALESALDALLSVTGARFAMVATNIDHPELGPCSQALSRAEVTEPGAPPIHEFEEYWYRVPWSRQPEVYRGLATGVALSYRVDELSPTTRELYDGSPMPTRSVAMVPIMMDEEWRGSLAYGYREAERDFAAEDLLLFQTAADMIAAFWLRQEAQERLQNLIRSKDEFVAAVSHELRTPLTMVVGLAEELRDRAGDFGSGEQREFHALIAEQAMEMANIVDDLLVAARGDIGSIELDPGRLDVSVEISRIVSSLSPDRSIEVCATAGCVAVADAMRVRQVLRNLITNAVRYGGPEVWVDCGARGAMVVIAVSDDGAEIEATAQDRIFEPYQRAHEEPTQPASVGLGLTVSRRLARLMGGDLTYHRAANRNIFELTLPAASD